MKAITIRFAGLLVFAGAHPAHAAQALPWIAPAIVAQQHAARDDSTREAVAARRARLLVGAMTLDQKLQQLTGATPEVLPELPQCFGGRHVGGIAALAIPTFRITNGPVGVGQNDCVSLAVAKAPAGGIASGIVAGAYTDPSSARATALPSAIAVAASFDPEIAARFGGVIATEMNNLGLHVFEAPGVNLARLPILGRNFEYFGEDPYLAGTMAVAEIRAVQSRGLIAMVKHFAANEQETNRMTIHEIVDPRTLRELYLLPFEMAVKDGRAGAVMCAYNFLNGQASCENRALLTDVLRGDWGFTGYVQSDFFATKSTVPSLAAGMDHEMPLPLQWAPAKLRAALDRGEITIGQIDTALLRRYTQMFKAGIFDRKLAQTPIAFAADGREARAIGGRGAVLLQNTGALPLRRDLGSLVLLGKASQVYARQAVAGGAIAGQPMGSGGGSSDVVPAYSVTPVDGLRRALADLGNTRARVRLVLVDDDNLTATIDGQPARFADALGEAARADAVVIMAGTIAEEGADRATFVSGNGRDLATSAAQGHGLDWYAPRSNTIALQAGQNAAKDSHTVAMIAAILAARSNSGRPMAAKTALVLKDNAGVALPEALLGPSGPAMLEAWFPGQEDGDVVADVLFGRVEPAGRLPVTFPIAGKGFLDRIAPAQFPGVRGAGGEQVVTYQERLAIGYRWYDANPSGDCAMRAGRNPCVAFPFGHGLSYTRFAIGKPGVQTDAASGRFRVTARVTNLGKRAGGEVVQVYLSLPPSGEPAGAMEPPRRLVGFARVALAPGASREIAIGVDPAASNHPLGTWDEAAHAWTIARGTYTVWVGRSSAEADLVRAGTIVR